MRLQQMAQSASFMFDQTGPNMSETTAISDAFVKYCKGPKGTTAVSLIGQTAYDHVLQAAKRAYADRRERFRRYVVVATIGFAAICAYFALYQLTSFWAVFSLYCSGIPLAVWVGKLMVAGSRFSEPTVDELKAVSDVSHHGYIDMFEDFRQRLGRGKIDLLFRDINGAERAMNKSVRRAFLADHGRLLILDVCASDNWKYVRRFNRPNNDFYAASAIGPSLKLITSKDLLTMPQADYQRISQALDAFAQIQGGHSSIVGSRGLKVISYLREAALTGKTLTQTWSFLRENGIAISESEVEKLSSTAGHKPFNRFLSQAPLHEIL
jgi:hypothetical protein